MIPIEGQPILTAAQMRAAEERAIAAGSSVEELMERAGAGVAEAVRRLAAGAPVLILCGPGNNGGDGYVAARVLKANGANVRVAATAPPKSQAALKAHMRWGDIVEPIEAVPVEHGRSVLVDAIFGTGLSRPIEDGLADTLDTLIAAARLNIAVDLPTGVDGDSGAQLSPSLGQYRITLALGAVKPAHVIGQSAITCGEVRLVDLDIDVADQRGAARVIERPIALPISALSTKYSRGMVAVIGGRMPGAATLASEAAMRAGAGYVMLIADQRPADAPHALVTRPWASDALDDKRIDIVVIGPGLGRDDDARMKLDTALATDHFLVIDGDALHLIGGRTFHDRAAPVVLTPHGGEFEATFGAWSGSKIDAARRAAERSSAVVVFKGPDTVIADPEGNVRVAPRGSRWLSTAGTGDVLAGTIGAMMKGNSAILAAELGVWLHTEAARRLGGAFIADDLARELSAVRASL